MILNTWAGKVDSVLFVFWKNFGQAGFFPFFLVNIDNGLGDFLPDSDLKMCCRILNHSKTDLESKSNIVVTFELFFIPQH